MGCNRGKTLSSSRLIDIGVTAARYGLKDKASQFNKYKRIYDIANRVYKFSQGPAVQTHDLQRTYNWKLLMPFDLGGVSGTDLTDLCQEVRFGDYSIADLSKMKYGARTAFFAGSISISTVTLVFVKPIYNCVSAFFYAWRNMIISPEGFYSPKNAYAKSIYVELEGRGGNTVTTFILRGLFPKSLPVYDLRYEQEDVVKLSIECSVDEIEVVY